MPLVIKLALLFVFFLVVEVVSLVWRAWRFSVNERKREREALKWSQSFKCVACHGSGVVEVFDERGQLVPVRCAVCSEQEELSERE